MSGPSKRLLIPARLSVLLLSGAATACSSQNTGPATLDAQSGGCSAPTPKGKVCVTICLDEQPSGPPSPFSCDIFCDLPNGDSGAGSACYLSNLNPTSDCTRTAFSDGGGEVLC